MKKTLTLITLALAALSLTACSNDKPASPVAPAPQAAAPAAMAAPAPTAPQAGGTTGTVTETMDAAGYTYLEVDSGTEKIWAAAPQFPVAVGDSVIVPEGMPMSNYHSKTLDRDFPVVYFVDSIMNASSPGAAAPAGEAMTEEHSKPAVPAAAEIDLSNLTKAEGGVTVGEVFSGKDGLAGKEIVLRGKVVKFSAGIMGKNWIHVQDGSGDAAAGTNDLTVTTDVTANVGDTILVTGGLTLDKDFGYGYQYNVIIEDAKVTVE